MKTVGTFSCTETNLSSAATDAYVFSSNSLVKIFLLWLVFSTKLYITIFFADYIVESQIRLI
jgi:hypothetical protein